MWGVAALKDEYEVSLVTAGDVDLAGLNAFYGTSLRAPEFAVREAPVPFFLRRNARAAALRAAYYQRFCRRIAPEFDAMISAYNFCDFGVPAIHFVADVSFDRELCRQWDGRPRGLSRLVYGDSLLRRAYLWLCDRVRDPSGEDYRRQGLTLANSGWTARLLKERCGIEAGVLYPPVAGDFPSIPHEQQEDGFVFIARIAPEKRIEFAVEILQGVRAMGHDIHFHVVGQVDADAYGRRVRDLCLRHQGWIHLEGRKSGSEKAAFLARHRYGINACPREAFGISVAEQVKAGSIVFVPSEGGQAEIVDHPQLTFDSQEDAIQKVDAVLRRPALREELRRHLAGRGQVFSVASFTDGIRAAVSRFLQAAGAGSHSP